MPEQICNMCFFCSHRHALDTYSSPSNQSTMSGKDDLDKLRNSLAFHIPKDGSGRTAVTKDDYPKFIAEYALPRAF